MNRLRRMLLQMGMTFISVASVAQAQNVKATPIGQRTGEFCSQDRALLFEDPTGVRILYDPGNTIAGTADPRLGDIHAILISHAHGDHLGGSFLNQDPNAPNVSCGGPALTPTSNTATAEIAAAKNAAVIAGGPLATFIGIKIGGVLGLPGAAPGCPASGLTNELTVPRTSPCTAGLGISAKRTVRHTSASVGVQVTAVAALHTNELSAAFLSGTEATNLAANGLGAHVGLANGFVVTFTNGLKVYLSGDTGLTSEMGTVVNGLYGVNLTVLNIGDIFTTGPDEAASAVLNLIRPASVIPSHANEVATAAGQMNPGTRTARFGELLAPGLRYGDIRDIFSAPKKVNLYLPLSGTTMEFDRTGRCVSGCAN